MKICVIGEDSLAAATTICCSRHFTVYNELVAGCDFVWVAYDTPIIDDIPDSEFVIQKISLVAEQTDPKTPIIVSSQLPVGSTARMEKVFPNHTFIHSPENIRVATAVSDFENQARIVVGVRNDRHNAKLQELLSPFTKQIIFTDPETAEMCKHSLNCLLGLSIVYINEVAKVCKLVGADVDVITQALRSDARFSPKMPIKAGGPYGGGHLARDVFTVNRIAQENGIELPIISNIKRSNES
jgi:UDPglucose 6-dehydrogenase